MPSPDISREVLGIVSSNRPPSCLADLVQTLAARPGRTGSLALEAVTTLVRWGLVEVRDGERLLALDQVDGITQLHPLDDFKLRITPEAREMQGSLGLRLDGSLPVFGIPERAPDQPDVFVIMPFTEALAPVFATVKKVGEGLKLKVKRGDEALTANVVMEDIWSSIYFARLVVADCTGRNPNVFYEIGLAHAIGKTTILLSQTREITPFNIQHWRVIFYEATPEGLGRLATTLEETVRRELAR